MRWSLVLSTFIAAQFALSFAAVIPSSDQLQRRAGSGAKVPSKVYRENARHHPYAYKSGSATRERLEESERVPNNDKMLMTPKIDADHVFEHQMLAKYLVKQNLEFSGLHPDLQKNLKDIINGPGNVVPVSASINRGKGQFIRYGIVGKAIKPKEDRDEYIKLTYGTARETANQLDQALKNGGHDLREDTLHAMLRNTMISGKLMHPDDDSLALSRAPSPGLYASPTKGTPKRPVHVNPVEQLSPPKAPAGKSPALPAVKTSPGLYASSTKGTPKRPARVNPVGKPSPPKAPSRKFPAVPPRKSLAFPVRKLPAGKSPALPAVKKSPGLYASSTKGTLKRPARVNPVGKPSPRKLPAAPARKSPAFPVRKLPAGKSPALPAVKKSLGLYASSTKGTLQRPARVNPVGKPSPPARKPPASPARKPPASPARKPPASPARKLPASPARKLPASPTTKSPATKSPATRSSPGSYGSSTKGSPKPPARVNPVGKPSPPKAPAKKVPASPARKSQRNH